MHDRRPAPPEASRPELVLERTLDQALRALAILERQQEVDRRRGAAGRARRQVAFEEQIDPAVTLGRDAEREPAAVARQLGGVD